ncbi:MAG: ImmA/IrrE family metallo-endopeptidase [Syntrophomonadaceae bacterium]|nr:ImmA/IrrE family metallo-endopeptidase [Syntrophomonadaceae bacterium]
MYLLMAEKATQLLRKYQVKEFPIPLDVIEHILLSEGIDIQIAKYLNRAVFCDNTIYIGQALDNSCRREYLVHEAGHVYHAGNTALLDSFTMDKNEAQAQAFAAYFLMPIGVFEAHLARGETDYALGEIFGVKQELVAYRKELSKALAEGGCYNRQHIFFNYTYEQQF